MLLPGVKMIPTLTIIEKELSEVNKFLTSTFDQKSTFIKDILHFALNSGGKRIRPSIVLLTSKLFRGTTQDSVTAASIIEVVHTASLLHDDVVDNTNSRRGLDAVNVIMNNKISVLLGDYLFTKAYARMMRIKQRKAATAIADAVASMSLGQILEAYYQGNLETSLEEYFSIIESKTASLFASSAKIGAIIGEAPDECITVMTEFGRNFGMAFQIIDDSLNFWGESEIMGKPAGSDLKEKKITLPILYLWHLADENERELIKETIISSKSGESQIKAILEMMNKYNIKGYCMNKAGDFSKKAIDCLTNYPTGEAKNALIGLCEYILVREK